MTRYFNTVVGNPPYNEDFNKSGNKRYARPLYHHFINLSRSVGDQTVLVTPARFLFDAGSTPLIGTPLIGTTQTFLTIGKFHTQEEAENCFKYIKTKFARVLLSILKITQANTRDKWRYVPLQDFTSSSPIHWKESISHIDQQFYTYYGLTEEEEQFIESISIKKNK